MIQIDPYICKQASCRASLLVSSAAFHQNDWEDLKQEMVFDAVRRSPKFDPSRGEWRGFVRGVTRNHAAVLVVRERRRYPELLSGDLLHGKGLSESDYLDMLDTRLPAQGVDALHLSVDVQRVVQSLPTQLRSLAVMLGQMPVYDVCRQAGKSRSRVYQMIRQIREAFLLAGILSPHARRRSELAK